jgi:hypothetical protein
LGYQRHLTAEVYAICRRNSRALTECGERFREQVMCRTASVRCAFRSSLMVSSIGRQEHLLEIAARGLARTKYWRCPQKRE